MATFAEYYQGLLLAQWQDKDRAVATIGALANAAYCDNIFRVIQDAFNIETAVGPQLDVIGKYLDFSRRVLAQATQDFMTMADYDAPVECTGFTLYGGGANELSVFLRYTSLSENFSDLSDEDYRVLLKLKLILNLSPHTLSAIAELLYEYFGLDLVCYDNRDMTLSYAVKGAAKKIGWLALQQNMLPRPAGVALAGLFELENPAGLWGYVNYGEPVTVEGWETYEVGFTDTAWLQYSDKITIT